MDQIRATPTSLGDSIKFALCTFNGKGPEQFAAHIGAHVKDYAAQKFQAAMLRAEQAGNAAEAGHLADLFTTIYGAPGERMMKNELVMWVIYWNTKDFPGEHVARLHSSKTGASPDQLVRGTIEELRERFDSQGLVNIGRYQQDDPCIVEAWI